MSHLLLLLALSLLSFWMFRLWLSWLWLSECRQSRKQAAAKVIDWQKVALDRRPQVVLKQISIQFGKLPHHAVPCHSLLKAHYGLLFSIADISVDYTIHINTSLQNRITPLQCEKYLLSPTARREVFFMSMHVKFEYTGPFKTPWHRECKVYLNSMAIQIFTKQKAIERMKSKSKSLYLNSL